MVVKEIPKSIKLKANLGKREQLELLPFNATVIDLTNVLQTLIIRLSLSQTIFQCL